MIFRVRAHAQNAKRRKKWTAQTVEKRPRDRCHNCDRHIVHLQHLVYGFRNTLYRNIIYVLLCFTFITITIIQNYKCPPKRYSETLLNVAPYLFPANRNFLIFIISPSTFSYLKTLLDWSREDIFFLFSPLLYILQQVPVRIYIKNYDVSR